MTSIAHPPRTRADVTAPSGVPTDATTQRVSATLPPVVAPLGTAFRWGAATSSHQIEGAVDADGRGPSIWETFAAVPGNVVGGDTAEVAVDHYHRWAQDLDLLAWLGVDTYRFSVSWSRVVPDASGQVNQAGLDFYRRLVHGLHERGIEPSVTLYHWDLPQWLQDRGGWASRDTVRAFVDYAAVVGEALDTVTMWATHNEPWCAAFLGHSVGVHAPGLEDPSAAVAACHHLLLSHGRAVPVLREVAGHQADAGARLGIVLNVAPVRTPGQDDADHEAVRVVDGGRNRAWLDPIFHGRYPDDVLEDWDRVADLSVIHDGDAAEVAAPIDFLGINYYSPILVRAGDGASPEPGADGVVGAESEGPTTDMGWPIDASGLGEIVRRVVTDYRDLPIWITENGAAFPDEHTLDVGGADGDMVPEATPEAIPGVVDDGDRIDYLAAHLEEVRGLLEDGIDVAGYFVWSLLDNFEWAEGYAKRFGVVHVDYDTLVRTPKASAHWFRRVVAGDEG